MSPPPVTELEQKANVTVLQQQLHARMKCFAGKNKVYLRSVILENGEKTRPRIALKCPLRAEYGMRRHRYFEYIRDVCCNAPSKCRAFQTFLEQNPDAAQALATAGKASAPKNGTNGNPAPKPYRPPSKSVI